MTDGESSGEAMTLDGELSMLRKVVPSDVGKKKRRSNKKLKRKTGFMKTEISINKEPFCVEVEKNLAFLEGGVLHEYKRNRFW